MNNGIFSNCCQVLSSSHNSRGLFKSYCKTEQKSYLEHVCIFKTTWIMVHGDHTVFQYTHTWAVAAFYLQYDASVLTWTKTNIIPAGPAFLNGLMERCRYTVTYVCCVSSSTFIQTDVDADHNCVCLVEMEAQTNWFSLHLYCQSPLLVWVTSCIMLRGCAPYTVKRCKIFHHVASYLAVDTLLSECIRVFNDIWQIWRTSIQKAKQKDTDVIDRGVWWITVAQGGSPGPSKCDEN